jgi:hypothetical protein
VRQAFQLVEDHKVEPGQAPGGLAGLAPGLFLFEGIDRLDGGEAANPLAKGLDGLDPEGCRDMGVRVPFSIVLETMAKDAGSRA